jgi:hypothetical protein
MSSGLNAQTRFVGVTPALAITAVGIVLSVGQALAPRHSRLRLRNCSRSKARRPRGTCFRKAAAPSFRELKTLEAVQLFLDSAPEVFSRAFGCSPADPVPFLHKQFAVLAIGLQIERGDDLVTDQDR